ncbi:MAG: PstS family phosphate ABC transporter substrate-binding protein [Armatimonadota bacterium]
MKKTWLIVVGSVLALSVVAALAPVFFKPREKARCSAVMANQRQLAIAIQMYQQELLSKPIPALPTTLGFTADKFPGIDGSTSTRPLTNLLVAESLELLVQMYDGNIGLAAEDSDSKQAECYNILTCHTTHHGTHEAYVNLLSRPAQAGSSATNIAPCELILVARKPSADESRLANARGIELDVRPVALDAFVFLVNERNPVRSLTLDQIRAIYTGKTTFWQSLGGQNEFIVAYTRNENSGSEELMRDLVMGEQKMIKPKKLVLQTMAGPIEAIAVNSDGIAYSVYYYEHFIDHRDEIRLLAINGIEPTEKTIANRTYPLTTEVYVVTRKKLNPKSPAAKMRDWLLSTEGQQMVAKSGYVPVKAMK